MRQSVTKTVAVSSAAGRCGTGRAHVAWLLTWQPLRLTKSRQRGGPLLRRKADLRKRQERQHCFSSPGGPQTNKHATHPTASAAGRPQVTARAGGRRPPAAGNRHGGGKLADPGCAKRAQRGSSGHSRTAEARDPPGRTPQPGLLRSSAEIRGAPERGPSRRPGGTSFPYAYG